MQYYLPPQTQVSKDFLKAVFKDEKKILKKSQVNFVHVPGWDELSVKNLWKDLKNDSTFNVYFSDKYPEEKVPNRKYFFDILNTIYPEYLKKIMTHASEQRYTIAGEEPKKESIQVTDEWL